MYWLIGLVTIIVVSLIASALFGTAAVWFTAPFGFVVGWVSTGLEMDRGLLRRFFR